MRIWPVMPKADLGAIAGNPRQTPLWIRCRTAGQEFISFFLYIDRIIFTLSEPGLLEEDF
jgi:hypothetical protein